MIGPLRTPSPETQQDSLHDMKPRFDWEDQMKQIVKRIEAWNDRTLRDRFIADHDVPKIFIVQLVTAILG